MTAITPYPKVIVPTRNRPKKVAAFLNFLSHFYPGTQVIMADGSDPAEQEQVGQICAAAQGKIDVAFHPYPAELPYFERILDVIQLQSDALLSLCADDDYPIMETIGRAAALMMKEKHASCVVPFSAVLTARPNREMVASIGVAPNLSSKLPSGRLKVYARWRYATSYGVTRREALIARYRSLSNVYCAGFVDFQIGAEDSLSGKVLGMAELGAIRTHTLPGSYMRPDDNLIFLRRSADVLAIIETLTERLAALEDMDMDAARDIVRRAMGYQIAHLTGASAFNRVGFTSSMPFLQQVVQDQFAAFYDLFRDGTDMRRKFHEKLTHIGKVMVSHVAMDESERKGNYEVF